MDPKVYKAALLGSQTSLGNNTILDLDLNSVQVTCGQGNNILHVAAISGNKHIAERIISTRSSLAYETNLNGDTPLHIAARLGNVDIATSLLMHDHYHSGTILEAGASLLHAVNVERNTVLHEAARVGCFDIVELLIEKDQSLASFTNEAGESPLFLAVDRGFYDTAFCILETFPNCSIFGRNGMTAMHAAIIREEDLVVQKLLEKGGLEILEIADNYGWMPLHYAAHLGNVDVVQAFLNTSSSLAYIKDTQGMSALHIAARSGQSHVTRTLIDERPDVCELLDDKERTALHVAVENAQRNVVKTLLNMVAFRDLINKQDLEGNTSLHLAIIHEHYQIVEILATDSRVDKGVVNKKQMTAADIFSKSGVRVTTSSLEKVMISSLLKRHEVSQENIHKAIAGNNAWTTAGESEEEPLIDRKTESIVNGTELSKDDETMANLNIVIATFIAGITFAASVQVPGGYNGEGMANLKDKASFKFFLIYNSMGFGFAAGSLLIHFACEILPGLFRAFGMRFGFTGSAAGFQFVMWFTLCSISCTVVAFMYATNTVLYHNFSKFSFSSLVKSAPTWQLGLPATVANLSFCVPCLYLLFHLGRLYYWLRLKVLYLENGTILGIKVKGTPLLARLRKEKRSEKGHVNMMDFSLWYYIFVIFLVFYFL